MTVFSPVCRFSVVALLLFGGCGQQEPDVRAERTGGTDQAVHADWERGYRIDVPGSWRLASERMSRLADPRELLSIGTTALSWHPTDCEAFAGAAG
jgi:hypothetical protein